MIRRTPLKRYAPPRKKRPGLRRGEPSKEEKEATRIAVHERAHGLCEIRRHPLCFYGYRWPLEGDLYHRGHLVHWRGKRRFGWRESEQNKLVWGCPNCHLISLHSLGERFVPPNRPILDLSKDFPQ